eukprot:COSAG01_NODE_4057_length_5389_cov_15.480340_7_plen_258_part_00
MSSGAELSSAIAKALGLPSPEVSPAFEVTSSPERRPAPDFDNVRTRSNKAIADTDSIIADAMMMSPLVRPGGGGSGKGARTPTRADQAFWARRLTLHDGGAEGPTSSALKVHSTATCAAVSSARGGGAARGSSGSLAPRCRRPAAVGVLRSLAARGLRRRLDTPLHPALTGGVAQARQPAPGGAEVGGGHGECTAPRSLDGAGAAPADAQARSGGTRRLARPRGGARSVASGAAEGCDEADEQEDVNGIARVAEAGG